MKKTRLMVATVLYNIDPIVYSGHMNMFYRLGKEEDIEVIFLGPWRSPIDKSRNDAAQLALYYDCDYLFFYDDDMYFKDGMVPINLLRRMQKSNDSIHIMQALAFIRGYPFKPMIFKMHEIEKGVKKMKTYDDYEDHIQEDGLLKCDAVGCCSTIIDTKLFKMIPRPWFLTGEGHTEDIYFCAKAIQYLGNVGIYCDTTQKIGHLLERLVLTDENRKVIKDTHDQHEFNQLFLPDPTFLPLMNAQRSSAFDFKESKSPFEIEKEVPIKKVSGG